MEFTRDPESPTQKEPTRAETPNLGPSRGFGFAAALIHGVQLGSKPALDQARTLFKEQTAQPPLASALSFLPASPSDSARSQLTKDHEKEPQEAGHRCW